MLPPVAFPVLQYFSALSHKRQDFRKTKKLLNINVCFDCLYNFVWNIFHSKKKCARCDHNSILDFMRSILYSCLVLMKLELLDRFSKNTKMWNFIKIRTGGAEFFSCGRTDRQADMTKLIVAFCSFTNAPQKHTCWH